MEKVSNLKTILVLGLKGKKTDISDNRLSVRMVAPITGKRHHGLSSTLENLMDAVSRHKDYELRISVTPENGRYVPKMALQRATGGSGPSLQDIPNALGGFSTAKEANQAATAYLTRMVDGQFPGLKI